VYSNIFSIDKSKFYFFSLMIIITNEFKRFEEKP
jgi:hypothetical protein